MNDLFSWLGQSSDHLLIRSCVFHYEFEFIHPFSDGNGRIGRLWQSLILGKLHPVFASLPVENMVYANQEAYYNAISESSARADSAPFLEFMLGEILNTLNLHQTEPKNVGIKLTPTQQQILELIHANPRMNIREMAEQANLTCRHAERVVAELKEKHVLRRMDSNKTGYWQIVEST
jgi:Fic family protein